MLPSLVEELASETRVEEALAKPEPDALGVTPRGLAPSASHNAFENIALAHREIYSLYEIAQSMGTSLGIADTMALISSKLGKMVPWSGCSLFLQKPDSDELECRFAVGIDAPLLLETKAPGLAGWIVKHGHTLVNTSPRRRSRRPASPTRN
jgi:hypothetical protein